VRGGREVINFENADQIYIYEIMFKCSSELQNIYHIGEIYATTKAPKTFLENLSFTFFYGINAGLYIISVVCRSLYCSLYLKN